MRLRTFGFYLLSLGMMAMSSNASALTSVRPAPGGKVLFVVDGNDVRRQAGGERLLFVDGADIRPAPGGKRLLMLDGDNVRAEPAGPRIAIWDGPTLRRTPGGKILLVVDGADIRPEAGGERLLFLDGGKLGRAHLTAALYQWRPALFKLSAEDQAAASAAIAEGQAWDLAQAQPDTEVGTYEQLSAAGPLKSAGKASFAWSKTHYAIKFENGGWTGVGIKVDYSGYHLLGAIASGDYVTGVFKYEGGTWKGGWLYAGFKADQLADRLQHVEQRIAELEAEMKQNPKGLHDYLVSTVRGGLDSCASVLAELPPSHARTAALRQHLDRLKRRFEQL